MKYYVQVNRHWMVTVEAESALRAEHIFLDLDGVQYSNAFDNEGRKTDAFRGALLDCQTTSREDLEILSAQYTEAEQTLDGAKKLLQDAERELQQRRQWLAAAETFYARAQDNLKARQNDLFWAKVAIGLEEIPEELKDQIC